MFEKYTQLARVVIFRGRFQASLFGSPAIEAEHLLLGLLATDEPLCVRVFKSADRVQQVRRAVELATPRQDEKTPTSVDLPLSNSCKRVLSHAAELAERLNHSYIAPEHLLFGIASENESRAARILSENGVLLAEIEAQARRAKDAASVAVAGASSTGVFGTAKPVAAPAPSLPDLVAEARKGELSPLIGRRRELEQVLQILCRRTKNSAVLIGEPGIGKEAIVCGVAQSIADGNVPSALLNQSILRVDTFDLARALGPARSGATSLLRAVYDSADILYVRGLFDRRETISELAAFLRTAKHSVITTGTALSWKLALDREDEVARAFEPVYVSAPGEDETRQILQAHKQQFEAFHNVVIPEEAMDAAIAASARFLRHRALPDRVLDLIDDAGAAGSVRRDGAASRTAHVLTSADILNAVAVRTSLSLEAVQSAMAKPHDVALFDQICKDVASCVPPGRRDWVEGLISYLDDCSSPDADRLVETLRSAANRLHSSR
jgi:ATP-dependent Clp protease ATP-binding subunit ClpC